MNAGTIWDSSKTSHANNFRIRNAAEAQCPGRVFVILEMAPQEDAATTPATEAPHARMAATRKVLVLVVFAHDNQIGALIGVAAIIYRRSAAAK